MKYFIVPIVVVNEWQNARNSHGGLRFVQDVQGRWVVNTSAAVLWPDIDWSQMEQVTLGIDDFPQPETEI